MANLRHLEILRLGVESWNAWYSPKYRGLADLSHASLRCTGLRGVNFAQVNLQDADLRYADLRGADLEGADLRGTHLERADLRGARIGGAVGLTSAQVHGAEGDETTQLPARVTRPAHWTADAFASYLVAQPSPNL